MYDGTDLDLDGSEDDSKEMTYYMKSKLKNIQEAFNTASNNIPSKVTNIQEAFNTVSKGMLTSKAMEIIDSMEDNEYIGLKNEAEAITTHNVMSQDAVGEMMLQLVITRYIEPMKTISDCEIDERYEIMTLDDILMDLGIYNNPELIPQLKKHWLHAIRLTYVDKLKYNGEYISLREFPSTMCPIDTIQEIVGLLRLLRHMYNERDIMYKY